MGDTSLVPPLVDSESCVNLIGLVGRRPAKQWERGCPKKPAGGASISGRRHLSELENASHGKGTVAHGDGSVRVARKAATLRRVCGALSVVRVWLRRFWRASPMHRAVLKHPPKPNSPRFTTNTETPRSTRTYSSTSRTATMASRARWDGIIFGRRRSQEAGKRIRIESSASSCVSPPPGPLIYEGCLGFVCTILAAESCLVLETVMLRSGLQLALDRGGGEWRCR